MNKPLLRKTSTLTVLNLADVGVGTYANTEGIDFLARKGVGSKTF